MSDIPLRISPTAYAKLLFLRDHGKTEIGGFGISHPEDLTYIIDIALVKQKCNCAFVEFDDDSVADFFDAQVNLGRKPNEFGRIWVHTHPGNSATPSTVDDKTFDDIFGKCNWSIMLIVAKDGSSTCQLQFKQEEPLQRMMTAKLEFKVDYETYEFPASDFKAWKEEYDRCVSEKTVVVEHVGNYHGVHCGYPGYMNGRILGDDDSSAWQEYLFGGLHGASQDPVGFLPSSDSAKTSSPAAQEGGLFPFPQDLVKRSEDDSKNFGAQQNSVKSFTERAREIFRKKDAKKSPPVEIDGEIIERLTKMSRKERFQYINEIRRKYLNGGVVFESTDNGTVLTDKDVTILQAMDFNQRFRYVDQIRRQFILAEKS